ncbi:MAG: hypothetical protein WD737_09865 [Gemmatimonadota bacterium]
MKGLSTLAAILVVFAAQPALAQEVAEPQTGREGQAEEDVLQPETPAPATEAVPADPADDLQETLDELAVTLDGLLTRVANDPELRRSALDAAEGMVNVAEVVLAEQAEMLQKVLRSVADGLEELPLAEEPAAELR